MLDSGYDSKASSPGHIKVEFGDEVSISEYDGNIADMMSENLYTNDWTIIGTESPSEDSEDWFDMKFVQTMYLEEEDEFELPDVQLRRSLRLNTNDDVMCELLPFSSKSLGRYYEYFMKYVSNGVKGSVLMCLCQQMFKSPVFDIPGCMLVRPRTNKYDKSQFVTTRIDDSNVVVFVPMTAFDAITDALYDVDVRIIPTDQDTWSYSSRRVVMSKHAMHSSIPNSSWKGNAYTSEFERRIQCSAVATATLTVSVLLEPWQFARGKHTSKYHLKYVIHSVK